MESLEAEQIHVTLGRTNPLTYVISWVTLGPLPDEHANSIVLFTQVSYFLFRAHYVLSIPPSLCQPGEHADSIVLSTEIYTI